MKKIEQRAMLCLLLVVCLLFGLAYFVTEFTTEGRKWVSFAANRHLYNSSGQLRVGRILDRDGDILSWVNEKGVRNYYSSPSVREATLHAVGDASGNIGTGALVAFADRLADYHLLTGVYTPFSQGNDLYLTLDARYNYTAYQALNGRKGAVGVYNYRTGEVLCMVSSPSFDPLYPPKIVEGDTQYDGVYMNRFLSGTFTPGSVFKLVTLAAAIELIPDLYERTFTCTGSTLVGDGVVTCPKAHGALDLAKALSSSCNGVFAQLSAEVGSEAMEDYTNKAGLSNRYLINGLGTAPGQFTFKAETENQLGWAGVGQYNDMVNPCSLMVYMGAIANHGRAAIPQLILKTENALGLPSFYIRHWTDTLINQDTALELADLMRLNVTESYGTARFPDMDLCAKSGTAEVGGGKQPNAWFAGFIRDEATPYAFVVLIENGGSGADAAGDVAARVLDVIINGY